jgi:hypothetical protein
MVGEAGLHVPASYESLTLKRRVSLGLVTPSIRDAAVLRARVVAVFLLVTGIGFGLAV